MQSEEARAVLEVAGGKASEELQSRSSGGVESILSLNAEQQTGMAEAACPRLRLYCSGGAGPQDVVSDGSRSEILTGGDGESTGSPGAAVCSLPCVLFSAEPDRNLLQRRCRPDRSGKSGPAPGEAADQIQGGIGSFHTFLFDEVEDLCMKGEGI